MNDKNKNTSTKKSVTSLSTGENKKYTIYFWILSLFPFLIVTSLFLFQSEDDLPAVELLDNPPEIQASLIIAKKSEKEDTVIGRFWLVNRTSVKYRQISPFVIDALIATEDERFMNHSGVDFKGLVRSIFSLGSKGGASTIPQQLAKLLFTLQKRQEEEIARAKGETLGARVGGFFGKFRRINEKIQENIIAKRLEERYTKEEIITMYLNQFDFLYNAVGIENAARVYFNKAPINLTKTEAAMLVGMCKNPDLYNPYSYQVDNYKRKIANYKGIPLNQVTRAEIYERRSKDSIRAVERRNQVLYQWLKNSEDENDALQTKITREEYDKLKTTPVTTKFTSLDHKEGMAPYFRESMRSEVKEILEDKNEDGTLKYLKDDGTPYNIYRDGLKIYTTINPTLQRHAEYAVERHIKEDMQPAFDQNNKSLKNYPFANSVSPQMIERIMENARRSTDRYRKLVEAGASASDININFETPCAMRVFSWRGERDTTMTPNDSIRYYKAFLHAGLVSIDPQTGFVKAWVGGVNFKHFSYDHVRLGKRQVGSTIKPFVYATALSMGVVTPCMTFTPEDCAVETLNEDGSVRSRYRPSGQGAKNVRDGLALSSNPTTAAVMQKIGSFNPYTKKGGPYEVEKLLKRVEIKLNSNDVVPSMALGVMDLSLFEMVAAQCIFANNGYYVRPTTIERITDRNGKVIYSADAKIFREQALNPTAAYEVLKMMKGGVAYGTGSSLRSGRPWGGISAPTAGKTGTTQGNSDAWFMGLTPKLVTGVWVGAEDRVVRFRSTAMGQGARAALPIYGYFMQRAYRDKIFSTFEDFRQPFDYDPTKFDCSETAGSTPTDEIEIPFEF
jgi:penicillin-binding protein 1A